MSRRRRRDRNVGMPASSAGLMRFFEDESYGIKIPPEAVIGTSISLIVFVLLAHVFF
jgi:preprotein translocase subunit Sec61beta